MCTDVGAAKSLQAAYLDTFLNTALCQGSEHANSSCNAPDLQDAWCGVLISAGSMPPAYDTREVAWSTALSAQEFAVCCGELHLPGDRHPR